ncbi:MAG: hypothetical protein ABJC39_01360 [Chloroflexota bacterium]
MRDDNVAGGSNMTDEHRVFHAAWRWDGVGLEIAIAELPGVQILVPTLADATLAMRKRIGRELALEDGMFEVDLRPATK